MKEKIIYITLSLGLMTAIAFSLSLGAVKIPLSDVVLVMLKKLGIHGQEQLSLQYEGIITLIRLPRVLLGVMVGAALGISGAAIQGVFRNSLAEPGLIGISSGASLMAVLLITLEISFLAGLSKILGYYLIALGAFSGAALAAFIVYRYSKSGGKANVATMLLAGIAINAITGALTGLVTYLANQSQLRTITFWMLGSLGGACWDKVICLVPFVLIPVFLLPSQSKALNAFSLGEREADQLGMRTDLVKVYVILLATLAVGASVAITGIIGFIGLLVPHMVRLIGGMDNRYVLPASAILGALMLTLADMLCRTVIAPIELPIGVITALLGGPGFLYILKRDKKKFNS